MKREHTLRFILPCATLAIVTAALSSCSTASSQADTPQSFNGATETVTRGDLSGETTVQGTLHYADSYDLKSAFTGVITALPNPGTTLSQGAHIYTVAGMSAYLLHGPTPAWRDFTQGMSDGEDVKNLENALAELGYFHATPNEHFDWNTSSAITAWQKDLGLPQDGTLPLGSVLFTPEDVRVGALKSRVGDTATIETTLFEASSSRQIISANLKLSDQSLATLGTTVTIRLPGVASATTGTITAVEPPTNKPGDETSAENTKGGKERIIPITVTPDDSAALDGTQEASVSLGLTSQTRSDVLSVPLGALVALNADQFGVEIVDDGGEVRRVPVEVGLFAGGRVEISGEGITEGQRVAVPDR